MFSKSLFKIQLLNIFLVNWNKIQKFLKKWFFIYYRNEIFVFLKSSHHHHVTLVARISLTLSRHSSLSFIALVRSSGQHPVSSHSCWMYVRAGRPAFARPCVGVHKSTSLMSSSLLLQQCKKHKIDAIMFSSNYEFNYYNQKILQALQSTNVSTRQLFRLY